MSSSAYGKRRASNQRLYKNKYWSQYLQVTNGNPGSHSQFRKWALDNGYAWSPRPGTITFRNPDLHVPTASQTKSQPKHVSQWVHSSDHAKQTTRNPKYGSKSSKKPRSWARGSIPGHIPYYETLTAHHRLPPPPPQEEKHLPDLEGLTFDDRCYLHSILDYEERKKEYFKILAKNSVQFHKRRFKHVIQDDHNWTTCVSYKPH